MRNGTVVLGLALFAAVLLPCATARGDVIEFDSGDWVLERAQVMQHLGRTALVGAAYLPNVEFEDGVIEVDVSFPSIDARSYPGILFRMQSQSDFEEFYVRPHRTPIYPDAVQYAPTFNGVGAWQLYNGEGYTAATVFPVDEWVHMRLEVAGEQARLFLGESDAPVLVVTDLKHGVSSGFLGLNSPADGTAYFSNFEFTADVVPEFEPPPLRETPPGTITEWEITRAFPLGALDAEKHPSEQDLGDLEWQPVECEPSGLVNVARYHGRTGRQPDCVYARTHIDGGDGGVFELSLGYSDAVVVFLNGDILFLGSSAYRQRDPSFLGIVGLFDSVYLPLEPGENEVVLLVAESFGGWAFVARDADSVYLADGVTERRRDADFVTPESIVYDAARGVLYVSNYDPYGLTMSEGGQFISRLSSDGSEVERAWVSGLSRPTGLALSGGTLLAVERQGVARIDTETGEILERLPLPGARFPNDIAVAPDGEVYVSDSGSDAIFRLEGGEFTVWIQGGEIGGPNSLEFYDGELLVGNGADGSVKAVDPETGDVRTVVRLGSGVIDGIESDGSGGLLVSQWEGRLYRVSREGDLTRLVDTTTVGENFADFEYMEETDTVVVPTFSADDVVFYRIGGAE